MAQANERLSNDLHIPAFHAQIVTTTYRQAVFCNLRTYKNVRLGKSTELSRIRLAGYLRVFSAQPWVLGCAWRVHGFAAR